MPNAKRQEDLQDQDDGWGRHPGTQHKSQSTEALRGLSLSHVPHTLTLRSFFQALTGNAWMLRDGRLV
eukprot:scaffold4475_cov114-Isochrysis_galbana.AAC.3